MIVVFDSLIRRDDVIKIFNDISNSARYYNKKVSKSFQVGYNSINSQLLFIVYDALYKYSTIIGSMDYFNDFLDQLDKLLRKIDNVDDIIIGINKMIVSIICLKYNCDEDNKTDREAVIRYIYDKYYINGYYIYGYNLYDYKCSMNAIEKNFYNEIIKVDTILNKKMYNIKKSDYYDSNIILSNSFFDSCCRSSNYLLLFVKLFHEDTNMEINFNDFRFSVRNYNFLMKELNKVMNNIKLSSYEKKLFIDCFNKEWNLVKNKSDHVNVVLIPYSLLDMNNFSIDSFIEENRDCSLDDAILKLFRTNEVIVSKDILNDKNIKAINLPGISSFTKVIEKDKFVDELERTFVTGSDDFSFLNVYGKVSILVIVGACLIICGVIFTFILFE